MTNHTLAEKYTQTPEFKSIINGVTEGNCHIEGVPPSAAPLIVAGIFLETKRPVLVITPTPARMHDFSSDIECLIGDTAVAIFPSWEMLPFEYVSPSERIERERVTTLFKDSRGDFLLPSALADPEAES